MDRDEQILQTALRLFVSRGFHAVEVDQIGEAAGISGPAIYRHFSGKKELLAMIFDLAMDRLLETTGGATFDDPHEELRHLVRAHIEFVVRNPDLAVVHEREDRSLDEELRRPLRRRQRAYFGRWVACLDSAYPGRSAAHVTATAWAVLRLLNAQPTWPRAARSVPDVVEVMTALAFGCIGSLVGMPVTGSPSGARAESNSA